MSFINNILGKFSRKNNETSSNNSGHDNHENEESDELNGNEEFHDEGEFLDSDKDSLEKSETTSVSSIKNNTLKDSTNDMNKPNNNDSSTKAENLSFSDFFSNRDDSEAKAETSSDQSTSVQKSDIPTFSFNDPDAPVKSEKTEKELSMQFKLDDEDHKFLQGIESANDSESSSESSMGYPIQDIHTSQEQSFADIASDTALPSQQRVVNSPVSKDTVSNQHSDKASSHQLPAQNNTQLVNNNSQAAGKEIQVSMLEHNNSEVIDASDKESSKDASTGFDFVIPNDKDNDSINNVSDFNIDTSQFKNPVSGNSNVNKGNTGFTGVPSKNTVVPDIRGEQPVQQAPTSHNVNNNVSEEPSKVSQLSHAGQKGKQSSQKAANTPQDMSIIAEDFTKSITEVSNSFGHMMELFRNEVAKNSSVHENLKLAEESNKKLRKSYTDLALISEASDKELASVKQELAKAKSQPNLTEDTESKEKLNSTALSMNQLLMASKQEDIITNLVMALSHYNKRVIFFGFKQGKVFDVIDVSNNNTIEAKETYNTFIIGQPKEGMISLPEDTVLRKVIDSKEPVTGHINKADFDKETFLQTFGDVTNSYLDVPRLNYRLYPIIAVNRVLAVIYCDDSGDGNTSFVTAELSRVFVRLAQQKLEIIGLYRQLNIKEQETAGHTSTEVVQKSSEHVAVQEPVNDPYPPEIPKPTDALPVPVDVVEDVKADSLHDSTEPEAVKEESSEHDSGILSKHDLEEKRKREQQQQQQHQQQPSTVAFKTNRIARLTDPIQLPYEAFPSEERPYHVDAYRFAKLNVSEIYLYHTKRIEAGRKKRNIYDRIAFEILKARETYDRTISPQIRAQFDYLHHEIIKQLAEGSPELMGPEYPGEIKPQQ